MRHHVFDSLFFPLDQNDPGLIQINLTQVLQEMELGAQGAGLVGIEDRLALLEAPALLSSMHALNLANGKL